MKKIYALFMTLCLVISATAGPLVGTVKGSYPLDTKVVTSAKQLSLEASMQKAPAATQGMQYDATEGDLIRYYNESDALSIDTTYASEGQLSIRIVASDNSDLLSLVLFAESTVPGTIIPEGTYPITSEPAYGTAYASPGVQNGSVYPSFYGMLNSKGQILTPLYFLESGNVVVEVVDGNLKISIDAANSNNVPMTIVYEVGGKSEKVEVKGPLKYDATETDGALDVTYGADATVELTNGNGYSILTVASPDATNEMDLAFFYDAADPETVIPAGTYTIDDSYTSGTVLASSGVNSQGQVTLSFYANLNASGQLATPLYFLVSGTVEVTNVDGQLKVEVNAVNSNNVPIHIVYDPTPVKEEVTVPTNEELWEMFKPYYNEYYGLARADQPIDKVSTFAAAKMQEIMTDAASEYKWLGDYVLSVATAAGVTLSTDMAAANEGGWRWAVHAFFNAAVGQYGAAGTDFTEAGKPEKWGPYYLAAQKPSEPEVTTVTLTFDLTSDAVLDRMGRRYVMAEDATLGTVNLILPTFNTETASYTDASLVVGDSTYAATATFAADTANNKEVYTAVATSTDTIFNVTMTVTYPTVQEYTFFAMDDAEATVEDQGEEGAPFLVYTVEGMGTLGETPVEFELMVDQLNNIEGMIGEAFVMGTATSLYEEEGNLAVSGTAMDDAGNTYNIELWVPLAGGEVEIVITEEVDVTLYNLNLDVQGNMAMVTAGGETGVSFWLANLSTLENYYGYYFSDAFSNIWYGDAQLQPYGDGQYSPDGLIVSFISTPDAEGNAVKYNFTLLPGDEPTAAEPALKGVVKRAVQLGESVVVLTHEADGTAHIYNVVGEKISEVSQEGVIAVDTANAGDLLAISDIAVTEDGKLVAINYMQTQSGDDYVDAGYKRGETRVYLWDNLAGDPSTLFTSKMSSNWFRSKQGLTMAVKGTSDNMEIFTTGIHATKAWARTSSYRVIEGVYTEPDVNNNDYYHFYDVADAVALETTVGTQYELNASPLGAMNWILDAELINPVEIVEPETNNVEISTCVALTQDLGKKFNGATILKEGEQVLMVAPYATAEGLLAGVKVLDITAGLDAATEVATADLDAAVEATAAATAVAVAENTLTITLVADATIYTLNVELKFEPEYPVMEDNITNLIYNAEEQSLSGGPSTQYGLEVFLVLGQDNLDGTFALDLEQSSIARNDNDLTILSGYVKDIDLSDPSAPAATAVIVAQLSEFETYEFHLTMTSAPAEVTVISITDAAVVVDEWKDFPEAPTSNYALTMTADWTNEADGLTYPVKVEVLIYDPNVTEQPDAICNVVVGDLINGPWLGGVDGCYLTITTVEGVVTAKGVVTTSNNIALNLTISGKLPTTALDNIQVGNETMKVIRDGQLIIIKNDVEYNIQGAVVK